MNKNKLFLTILILTITLISIIYILGITTKYNKLVINNNKWNNIIKNKSISNNIKLENIKFNDYDLLIDEEQNIIYYSIVNSRLKYNPSMVYKTNNKNIKLAINKKLDDNILNQNNTINIMLYNNTNYRIYTLIITEYPILNIINNNQETNLELFDNHIDSPQKLVKSKALFKIIIPNQEYSFSLIKESLGHNKRENHISILGMDKHAEYRLTQATNINNNELYVEFFINNKHIGLYKLNYKERNIDNYGRNK